MTLAVRKRRPSKTALRARADREFSLWVRRRDGRCMVEEPGPWPDGHTPVLQAGHIVSRRYLATRFDPDNAVAICTRHHVFFTEHPLEWMDWVATAFTVDWYPEIKRRAQTGPLPDYEAVLAWLHEEVA